MYALVSSILALAAGPWVHRFARSRAWGLGLLDGFVVMTVGGLVLLGVVPEAIEQGGGWSLLLFGLGFVGPTLVERGLRSFAHQAHIGVLVFALGGLALHAALDGAALRVPEIEGPGASSLLSLAVILHRIPVGLVVWWLLRPFGVAAPVSTLSLMAGATTVGFGVGPSLLETLELGTTAWIQALVGGSLLHVVIHRHPAPGGRGAHAARFEGSGAILGIVFLGSLLATDTEHAGSAIQQFGPTLLALSLESAGPLLLGYAMAGIVAVFVRRATIDWIGRGGPFSQSLRGMLVGMPIQVCSCGVVPIYRALVQRGVPASAAMAFLVATPEFGLDAVALSLPMLGVEMTLVRLIAAATVALLVGWLVGRFTRRGETVLPQPEETAEPARIDERIKEGFRRGFGEIVDQTAGWVVLGLTIAAILQPLLMNDGMRSLPAGADVVLFALVGFPLYVCASGATPLVAILMTSGVSAGAGLALLLTGPATNVTTVGVLSRLHGYRTAITFALTTTALAILLGWSVNALMPWLSAERSFATTPEEASLLSWISLALLVLVYLGSLMRLGPRRIFSESLQITVDDEHDRCH